MLVELQSAQSAFEQLPLSLQIPTLSPVYCAADAHRDPLLRPQFLLFRCEGAVLLHCVHEASVPGGGADWQSPYGYGGPVGSGMTRAAIRTAWELFDLTARAHGVIAEFVRFHPLAANHLLYPGDVREDRNVVTIDLRSQCPASADLASGYSARGRNILRKAMRAGLTSAWEDPPRYADAFGSMYRESMQHMGAAKFYCFEQPYFHRLFALPQVRVLVVRSGERVVAAAAFLFGPTIAEYHLSATTAEGRALGATTLLLHEAATRAQRDGLTYLYLGGGTDARADNPLLRFKASFAPPERTFRVGSRILDAQAYARLQREFPEAASGARVLFYRGS